MGKTNKTRQTFGGINQDAAKSRMPSNLYYDALNVKLTPIRDESFGTISNAYGNKLSLKIPVPIIDKATKKILYGTKELPYTTPELDELAYTGKQQQIIGHIETTKGVILFTTDDSGVDCIWEVPDLDKDDLDINLLYLRNLDFSTKNPIQAIFNFENELIQKVYWVDGENYLRFINIMQWKHNDYKQDLIDIPVSSIDSKSTIDISKPEVVDGGGGGTHTAGMIQYGYSLYNLNGAETSISPLSDLFPLDKGQGSGGGDPEEIVGALPIVHVKDVDTKYDYIKLYAVKFTTYNGNPSIKLVYDGLVGNYNDFRFTDTGAYDLGTIGMAEFLFLGADPIKPKHIATKDNILFAANNKEVAYKIDLDMRAYSHDATGNEAIIHDKVYHDGSSRDIPYVGESQLNAKLIGYDNVPLDHDAVNLDFDKYRYKAAGAGTTQITPGPIPMATNTGTFSSGFDSDVDDPLYNITKWLDFKETTPPFVGGKFIAPETGNMKLVIDVDMLDRSGMGYMDLNNKDILVVIFRNGTRIATYGLDTVPNQVFTFNTFFNKDDEIQVALQYDAYQQCDPIVLENCKRFAVDIDGSLKIDLVSQPPGGGGSDSGEGGTGQFVEYTLTRSTEQEIGKSLREVRFFKDNEIYRIGILFFNKLGQHSEPKWIADFKAGQGNLEGFYNTLNVTLLPAFYTYIQTLPEEKRPVNYMIVRAIREPSDKTIISQGLLTGMFVQWHSANIGQSDTDAKKEKLNPSLVKTPITYTRGYGNGKPADGNLYFPLIPTGHNRTMNASKSQYDPNWPHNQGSDCIECYLEDEIYRAPDSDYKRQQSWQFTKLFQMHSPEAAFNLPIATTDSDELVILGAMPRIEYQYWARNISTKTFGPGANQLSSRFTTNKVSFMDYLMGGWDMIGPSWRTWGHSASLNSIAGRIQYYPESEQLKPAQHARRQHMHKVLGDVQRPDSEIRYKIYGNPEVTEAGQNIKTYNNDLELQYINNLSLVVSDEKKKRERRPVDGPTPFGGSDAPAIGSIVSDGNRCITLALGDDTTATEDRTGLDDIYNGMSPKPDWDVELFGEIRRNKSFVYSGAIYKGYTVSSRQRTRYIATGPVKDIWDNTVFLNSPGDTYVQMFKNVRLTKKEGAVYTIDRMSIVETLEYKVESTINLEERNDTSLTAWGSIVDPTAKEGLNYNRVYSTDSNVQVYVPDNQKIREIEKSEVEIIASKVKIPGEFVDNWVDFRPNDVMYLDGKFGPIQHIISHNDEIYGFQDFAVARIAVNPRVQTQGSDGIDIELGTGKVLHDYQYLSTRAGSFNKWSIRSTNSGLYYFDGNNRQLQRVGTNKGIEAVSEAKGLHAFLQNNTDRDILRIDNPIIGTGVVTGYDNVNGDVYSTVLQEEDKNFNVSFNEKVNAYTSFYSFKPTRYITKGERFFTVPSNNNELWVHGKENFQEFYGQPKEDSYITLLINTDQPGLEKVFNNIEYDSEVTLNEDDVYDSTLTSIEAWNTYQKSGVIPLEVNTNIVRKFRTWRAQIPREKDTRNRMRDKWLYLKLSFNPTEPQRLILHDITISYIA